MMKSSIRLFPWILACLAAVAVAPAMAAGANHPVSVQIQTGNGSCQIAASDLARALQGRSASCNQQMGYVVSIAAGVAPQPSHGKAIYDYTAWYSRPLDPEAPRYYGQRLN